MGLGAIGLLFSAFSTGLAMYGQSQQGKIADQVANYNAGLIDSEVANKDAEFAQGVARERLNQDRHFAAIRTQIASSGVQGTTGTPLNIVGDTASAFQTSVSDAARATAMQVAALRQKQTMLRYGGAAAQAASQYQALGTGLAGMGQLGSSYQSLSYQGALS